MAKEKELNRIIVTVSNSCIQSVFTRDDIDLEIIDWDETDKEKNPALEAFPRYLSLFLENIG